LKFSSNKKKSFTVRKLLQTQSKLKTRARTEI